jgi:hypothetical protein
MGVGRGGGGVTHPPGEKNVHQNSNARIGVRVKYGDDGDDGDDGVVVNFNGHISVVYPL